MTRAVLYARVSTLDKQDPEAQLEQLRAVARQREWSVVLEATDRISGSKGERPGLNAVLRLLAAGGADVLAATALDRVGRSLRHLVELHDLLRAWHVTLVLLREGVDTSTPTGEFVFQVMGAAAQLERALIRERVTSGVQRARAARGGAWGERPTLPRALVEAATLQRRQGATWGAIARSLGVARGKISIACLRAFPDLKTQPQAGGRQHARAHARGWRGAGAHIT